MGQHHDGPRAHPQGARRRGLRLHLAPPACAPTGPSTARPSPAPSGSTPTKSSPYELYQFFVRTPDDEVGRLLRFFTFLSHEEIEALDVETAERPERAPRRSTARSARSVTTSSTARPRPTAPRRPRRRSSPRTSPSSTRRCCSRCSPTRPSSTLPRSSLDGGGLDLVDVLVVDGPRRLEDGRAHRPRPRGRVRQQPPARRRRGAASTRDDLLADRYVALAEGAAGLPPAVFRVRAGRLRRRLVERRSLRSRCRVLRHRSRGARRLLGLARPSRCPSGPRRSTR